MMGIELANVANQNLFVQLEERAYQLTLHCVSNEAVAITIVRDEETLVSGQIIVPGAPLLPYRYQESGNFIFTTENGDLPDWRECGVTQFLNYVTADELTTFRAE